MVEVRVAEKELRLYYDTKLVAQHQRSFKKKEWIRDLSHYEKTLEQKPRAKVMAYREKLLGFSSQAAAYIAEICRRDRNSMNQQILKLYTLWEEHGTEKFVERLGLLKGFHLRWIAPLTFVSLDQNGVLI